MLVLVLWTVLLQQETTTRPTRPISRTVTGKYPYTSLSTSSNINGKDVLGNRLAVASVGSCFSKSTMQRDPRDSVGL